MGLVTVLSAIVAVVAFNVSPARADVDAVSGGADPVLIGGAGLVAGVSGSATEPATGYGPLNSGLLTPGTLPLLISPLLSLGLLSSQSEGGDLAGENHFGFAESSAQIAQVGLLGLNLGVVTSTCRSDGTGSAGNSAIANAGLLGLSNPIPANTSINLGVVGIFVNEQVETNTPGVSTSIIVRALRLSLLGIEIVLAESRCAAAGPDVLIDPTVPPTTAPPTTLTPTTVTPTTAAPATTTTTAGGVIIVTQTTVRARSGGLVRTGSDGDLMIAWAALAVTLGGLLVMGAQGLPATAPATGRRARRREAFREVFREMRRFR